MDGGRVEDCSGNRSEIIWRWFGSLMSINRIGISDRKVREPGSMRWLSMARTK